MNSQILWLFVAIFVQVPAFCPFRCWLQLESLVQSNYNFSGKGKIPSTKHDACCQSGM